MAVEVTFEKKIGTDNIHGGVNLLPVKLAQNLVRRYEDPKCCGASRGSSSPVVGVMEGRGRDEWEARVT